MLRDRLKWNKNYQSQGYPVKPAGIVIEYAKLAKGKKALDIAAGNGRNTLFLARQGFSVDAVDISDAGLNLLPATHPNIHPICADLDDFDIPAKRYDLIINIKYLNRRLFPYICEGLNPGGILIFQTLLDSPNTASDPPTCRDYLLRENELLNAFSSLRVLIYKESSEKTNDKIVRLATFVGVKTYELTQERAC